MSDGSPDDASTWTQPRFVIAALVVALIAVFAVVLAVTEPADGQDEAPPRAEPTSAPPSAQTDSDSACGLEPGDQTIPVVAPSNTDWELVGTVAAPTAPDTIGPGDIDDGLRSCFAHSPIGALYAAVNALAAVTDPQVAVTAVERLAAAGPGREAALTELRRRPPTDATRFQIAGFTVLNYSPNSTVVDLALRGANGGLAHVPLTMRWEEGDWKVVFPPDGNLAGTVRNIPDLTGYAVWSGA